MDRVMAIGYRSDYKGSPTLPFAELENGLIFRGLPNGHLANEAKAIQKDISFRYHSNRPYVQHDKYSYKPGDVVVEVGAYLGYYSMYICGQVGDTGKVLAIEMIPENYAIMERNLAAFQNAIAINKGVARACELVTAFKGGEHIGSLRKDVVAQYTDVITEIELRTESLDNILDQHDIQAVDMMIIQVNGTEDEVLAGCVSHLNSIRNMFVSARYSEGRLQHVQDVGNFLATNNFDVVYSDCVLYAQNRGAG